MMNVYFIVVVIAAGCKMEHIMFGEILCCRMLKLFEGTIFTYPYILFCQA